MRTFALLFLAISFTAAADQNGDLAKKFCEDPVEAICGVDDRDAQERADRLEANLEAAKRSAIAAVKANFPMFAKRENLTRDDIVKLKNHQLRDRVSTIYYAALLGVIERQLDTTHLAAKLHFESVKKRLETVVQRYNMIDPEEARDMMKNLKDAKLIDAVDVLRGRIGSHEMRDKVIESCNRDGFEENAFADTIEDHTYVIVCPGEYLGGLGPVGRDFVPNGERIAAGEVWTLGHETGHHIDSGEHPKSYAPFKRCLAASRAEDLENPLEGYMQELTADHFGDEELATYLRQFDSPAKRFEILRRNLIGLCLTKDDGEHPAGKIRIENTRRHPRIHRIMGCKAPLDQALAKSDPHNASCYLNGKYKTVMWSRGATTGTAVARETGASH